MPRLRKRARRNNSKNTDLGPAPLPRSRLKRPRRSPEPNQNRLPSEPPTTLSPQISAQLFKLNSQCASLSHAASESSDQHDQALDDVVRQCSDLLPKVGVATMLDDAPLVPQILRRAMGALNLTTVALTKCFIIFASQLPSISKENDPFSVKGPTTNANLVIAGVDWALLMFLKSLSLTSSSATQKCCRAHRGVLVGHRCEIRKCIVERSAANLSSNLELLRTSNTITMTSTSDRTLNCDFSYPLKEGLLTGALERAIDEPRDFSTGRLSVPLLHRMPELLLQKNGDLFDKLSLDDRADLLYVSDHIYDWFVQRLEQKVAGVVSWKSLVCETKPISIAARKHITLHWKLMDRVREAVEARTAHFKMCWWKRQKWMRVALAQVTDELSPKQIGERVPPALKLCMRQVAILVHALKTEQNIEAGVKAAQLLFDYTGLTRRIGLHRNQHAVLLVFEALVVRALWACGLQTRKGGFSTTNAARIGVALAVACSMGRTTGGRPIESEVQPRAVFDDLMTVMSVSSPNSKLITTNMSNVYLAAIMVGHGGKGNQHQIIDAWEQSWLGSVLKV